MPKRTREDSPSPPPISPSPTPDPSTPGSFDEPAHSSKYIQTSPTARTRSVMKCSLPPHETLEFSTFEEFEIHYSKVHAYRCSECRSNFPTEHFLGLHISENHDPLSEARRAREEKTNYDFLIVNTGIDKRSSMLRQKHRRHSSAATRAFQRQQCTDSGESAADHDQVKSEAPEASEPVTEEAQGETTTQGSLSKKPTPDADVDDLTSDLSSLKFVPPRVRFGRGGRRGGLSRT